jgi:cytochrome b subunit of formate dehydrogenase
MIELREVGTNYSPLLSYSKLNYKNKITGVKMWKRLLFSLVSLTVLAGSIWLIQNIEVVLFRQVVWACVVSLLAGTALGTIRTVTKAKYGNKEIQGIPVERHTIDSYLEHWGTATGIFVLIFSGIQLRTGSDILFSSNLHFLGLTSTLLFGSYFLSDFVISKKWNSLLPNFDDVLHGTIGKYLLRGKWDDEAKYRSSQKSAFLLYLIIGSEIVITGAIKLAAMFLSVPGEVLSVATSVHDIASSLLVLLVLVHILIAISKRSHRALFFSWFTGKQVLRQFDDVEAESVSTTENLIPGENNT